MTEDIEHQLDRMSRESRKRVRAIIQESERLDLLVEFDAKMKDIDLGIDGARSTWSALSDVQKSLVKSMHRDGGYSTMYARRVVSILSLPSANLM